MVTRVLLAAIEGLYSVADPDLQIRGGCVCGGGGEGGGHPDPEISGGPVSKKIISALGASVWSKNKWGGACKVPNRVL